MLEFLTRTWFVWWIVSGLIILRWLHVLAPDNSWDESQPDPRDEEFQYFSESVDSTWLES